MNDVRAENLPTWALLTGSLGKAMIEVSKCAHFTKLY